MEINKKTWIIISSVAAIILISAILTLGLSYYKKSPASNLNLANAEPGTLPGMLPPTGGLPPAPPQPTNIQKEKLFVSAYFQTLPLQYSANVAGYDLPIENIKEKIINYRDFSRKIPLDSLLNKLESNGFAVAKNPTKLEGENLENFYENLKNLKVPIFVSTDSVVSLYNFTLNTVYKEIEEEIFYDSLWRLTKNLYNSAKLRYEERFRRFGIQYDLLTESSRLELAYFSVALELLKPKPNQIKETITESRRYFNQDEALRYQFTPPASLEKEINQEINLIKRAGKATPSPLFLYPLNYQKFTLPPQYLASEKLKNYYLASSWLENIIFPLYPKDEDCSDCLLDEEDLNINFVAAALLATELAKNQDLKNQWANIYKTRSFFKGLELDLTYLDYFDTLKKSFGENYDLEKIFGGDDETIKENIKKITNSLAEYKFLKILGGQDLKTSQKGLRILRKNFLPENYVFKKLSYPQIDEYQLKIEKPTDIPFSACLVIAEKKYERCLPMGLDIFNVAGIFQAEEKLSKKKEIQYDGYQTNLAELKKELENFDQYSWHDNAYWSLIFALKKFIPANLKNYPTFMKSPAWQEKQLATILGSWTDFHREINLEKTAFLPTPAFSDIFSYGYLEPLPDFYNELLANVRMVKNGFSDLQILKPSSRSFTRLANLEDILRRSVEISVKELKNKPLDLSDYDFISGFSTKLKGVIGDIIPEAKKNKLNISPYKTEVNLRPMSLNENLNEMNLIIVIYPTVDGQLFLAAGPVFNYLESKSY